MIVCLDLEGVLVPEIWIAVANQMGVPELKRTTRDEPDYNKLMRYRLNILRQHDIRIQDIQKVIGTLKPLPGAKSFMKKLRSKHQVIILSDTFYEFAEPLMRQLDYPTLFCNFLKISSNGVIRSHKLRQVDGKRKAVLALKSLKFKIVASGDSFNDLTMLQTAHRGILFRPPDVIAKKHKRFKVVTRHTDLLREIGD